MVQNTELVSKNDFMSRSNLDILNVKEKIDKTKAYCKDAFIHYKEYFWGTQQDDLMLIVWFISYLLLAKWKARGLFPYSKSIIQPSWKQVDGNLTVVTHEYTDTHAQTPLHFLPPYLPSDKLVITWTWTKSTSKLEPYIKYSHFNQTITFSEYLS